MRMRDIITLIETATAPAGMIGPVYHATKRPLQGDLERREGTRSAFLNTHTVMANGLYFALTPEDAAGYGRYIGTYMLRVHRPLLGGELSLSPKQQADLQYILEPLFSKQDGEWLVFEGMQKDYYIQVDPEQRDPDWHQEFICAEAVRSGRDLLAGRLGLDWEVLDHKACVDRMHQRGYDGILVHEKDQKVVGVSWFVPDPSQVVRIETPAQDT